MLTLNFGLKFKPQWHNLCQKRNRQKNISTVVDLQKNKSVHKCGRERDQEKTIQTVTFGQPLNQVQFVILLFRLTSGSYLQTINCRHRED